MKGFGTGAWLRRGSFMVLTAAAILSAGCGGGGGGGGSSAGTQGPTSSGQQTPGNGNAAPSISATPVAKTAIGSPYTLTPVAQDADGDALAFSIENRPEWAQFSTVTGNLTGTPNAAGTYADIKISVSDGKTTVALAPFSIDVGTTMVADSGAVLNWELPTLTVDGQPIGDLAGFRIHYGKSEQVLAETIEVQNPGVASYVVDHLPAGTYYFAVRAITSSGAQSPLSNVITKVIG